MYTLCAAFWGMVGVWAEIKHLPYGRIAMHPYLTADG